ncbi:choice-of-anchor L domain-containing protein [Flavobacterium sp. J372]|uniref:choice-of-anchor L domain-containing protein n=1 Tax=Flavobacterium sp. J372 TaxID=2898436 RepID=UPI0021513CD9|nr:choice-of-anchor L domain-containing protein [Flavobacterium sp. J372]MCR5860671.1 choice-of-anchor L domain-containing protein [Flavobacterium sp. J372]
MEQPGIFCTVAYGATCAAPRAITTLPFSETSNTAQFGNDYSGTAGTGCNATGNYLAGNDVVYAYTADFTGNISVSMTNNGPNSGMFIYTSCTNIGTQCAAGGTGSATTPVNIPLFPVTAGQTYYIVIATNASSQTTPYTLTVQRVNCQAPTNVSIVPSDASAQLTWTAAGATSWEYYVDVAGGPIPSGAGTEVTATPTVNAPDLSPGTQYQYWVRANCGNGTFSAWAGPYTFQTSFCPITDQCNYTFVLRDSFAGWEGAVITVRQNGVVVATLNLPTGTGPVNVNVPLCHGVPFELRWDTAGNFPNEVGISIINPFAQTIFTKAINTPGSVGSLYSDVTDCLNPKCLAPTGLAIVTNSITTTSVGLRWDGPATGTWEYILLPEGSPAPTGDTTGWVATGVNPTTGITIEPNSSYVAYLRLVCAATNETSPIAGPIYFNSGQIPAALEYNQDFELPANGFARNNASQPNKWVVGTAASNGGTTGMYISNDGGASNAYTVDAASVTHIYRDLQIPALGTATAQEIGITFDWRAMGEGGTNDYLRVWMVPATFTPTPGTQITAANGGQQVASVLNQNGAWTTSSFTINSTAYAGQARRLVFEWRNNATVGQQPPAAIDNINVQVITCRVPTALALTVGSVTTTSASVTWVAPTNSGTPTYDYYLSTSNTVPQESTEPTETGITTTNANITTLEPSTTYYLWVRSNCGDSGASFWVGPLVIITPQIPAPLTWDENFETLPAKWTLNNGTQVNKWVIGNAVNNGGTNSLYITSDNGATNTYSVTSQSVVQAYRDLEIPMGADEVDVTFDWKSVGDANDYFRVWMVPVDFNPNPGTQIGNAANRQRLGTDFLGSSNWTTITYTANVEAYEGTTRRLVFEWRNNNAGGIQPPAAIDNINVKVVTCRKPQNLAAPVADITQTTAILGWTPMNGETSWDVVVQLPNLAPPTAATVGTPVPGTLPTFTAQDLQPATFYVFYVRANCGGTNGSSSWAGPFTFITKIANDECANAKVVPVNSDTQCLLTATGTVTGATASAEPKTCAGTADDDVWFQFTATSTSHTISLLNIAGSSTNLNFVVYKGSQCGTMTQIICSDPDVNRYDDYEIGAVYKIRVYTSVATPNQTTTFTVCITSPEPPIKVNGTLYTYEQLVKEVLVNSGCAIITNVQGRTGTNYGQTNGIGYFTRNGSNFPFDDGIVLATGNIFEAQGPYPGNTAGNQTAAWVGDPDLSAINAANGNPDTMYNASVLEFDFVPLKEDMSFDFLFASAEYGTFQCGYSDAFAFILTGPLPSTTSQNLAVIPNTTIPVSVTNIRDGQYNSSCGSANVEFFGSYNATNPDASPIGYIGNTTMLTAQATVIQGAVYHIKLVIADYRDQSFNSAVFLRGGSFDLGEVQLPDDFLVSNGTALCDGQQQILDSGLSPLDYEFQWLLGTTLLPETGPTLTVTQPGTYTLKASYIGSTCSGTDSILVEFYPDIAETVGNPNDLVLCDNSGFATFDLSLNTATMLSGLTVANYDVKYYATQEDADNNVVANALPTSYLNTVQNEQTIYVRVANILTGCPPAIKSFKIIVQPKPQFTIESDFDICVGSTGTINVTGGNWGTDPVTYEWTFNGPVIPAETGPSITVSAGGVYTVKVTNGVCSETKTVTVTQVTVPVVDEPADGTYCGSYTLPALTSGNYYTEPNGGGTMLAANTVITQTQPIYVYAAAGTANQCFDEHMFTVTINPQPEVADMDDVQACNTYTLPAITVGNYFTGPAGTGTMLNAGDVLSTDQTIYIYAQSGTTPNCTDEDSFNLTITNAVVIPDPADVESCTSYTLPALTIGNYYTGPNGTGTMLNAGDVITTTQTIYVFEPGSTPICDAQQDFLVTIYTVPQVADMDDVQACNTYTLPAITVGNYFTGPAGTGTMLNAGDVISTDQTIYIYAQTGTTPNCTDEDSFNVTLTSAPVIVDPADVERCASYTLPALTIGNYYTGPNGTGTMLNAGDVITTTQTIYVFEPGGSPICDAEQDFLVTINIQPNVVNPGNIPSCGPYTLPALAVGDYFTGPGGSGTMLNAGDVITADQTIYIYAQTGNAPNNCTDEESFNVTITTPLVGTFSYNTSYCQDDTNPLPQLDGVGGTFSSTAGLVINPTTGEINIAQSTPGTYEIRNTVAANGGCASFSETFTVTIGAVPNVFVEQGCDGNNYVLEVNFDNDEVYNEDTVTFSWIDPSGNPLTQTGREVIVTATGTYNVIVTPNAAGACAVTVPVQVDNTTCMVQRGISPNNDGKNDTFNLSALDVTKISIFNRYGQEVFSYGAYTDQWHGQGKGGDELPTGTYFYSFERANGEKATGWVYINREE